MIRKKNAVLKFETVDNQTGNDPVTGEPIFSKNTSTVDCSLEQNRTSIDERVLEGVNDDTIYLYGRCLNPTQLTIEQRKQTTVNAEILTGNQWRKCKLQLRLNPNSVFGFDSFFGERIECKLITLDS